MFNGYMSIQACPSIIFPRALATKKMLIFSIKTSFHGAQATIYCCVEDKIEGESGYHYEGCARTTLSRDAHNEESAKKLWEISEKLVGLKEDA